MCYENERLSEAERPVLTGTDQCREEPSGEPHWPVGAKSSEPPLQDSRYVRGRVSTCTLETIQQIAICISLGLVRSQSRRVEVGEGALTMVHPQRYVESESPHSESGYRG